MGEKDYVMLWQAKMIINTGMRTDIPAFTVNGLLTE